ncbi:MAG: hypothetical protein WC897_05660 [Candidatus Gracilibacteria bacterium]
MTTPDDKSYDYSQDPALLQEVRGVGEQFFDRCDVLDIGEYNSISWDESSDGFVFDVPNCQVGEAVTRVMVTADGSVEVVGHTFKLSPAEVQVVVGFMQTFIQNYPAGFRFGAE